MAQSDTSQLRLKNTKDLQELLLKEKAHLRDLHFRLAGAQLKNIQEITATRRAIARIVTIINEKEQKKNIP